MTRPRLLDLFCGAGGCSVGYHRAGFDVEGIDLHPHPDYPYRFTQRDALEVLADTAFLNQFDVVHASPPCPRYSAGTREENRDNHPDLLAPARELLRAWGGVYVIENVPRAPMDHPVILCGGAFSLHAVCRDGRVRALQRHRLFESNVFLMSPGCMCDARQKVGVYGNGGGGEYPENHSGYTAHREEARQALGIDWMTSWDDLTDAIPPAYTQYLGEQLLAAVTV